MQAFELGCCERLASSVEESVHSFRFQVTTHARITFFYLELMWISRYATGFFLDFLEGSDGTAGRWDVASYTPRELRLSFIFSVSAPRDNTPRQ